jgi:hypothetical protein
LKQHRERLGWLSPALAETKRILPESSMNVFTYHGVALLGGGEGTSTVMERTGKSMKQRWRSPRVFSLEGTSL